METCKALSSAGAKVIMCSRSMSAGEKAAAEASLQQISGSCPGNLSKIVVKELDLSSLRSIEKFATEFLATESRLDFLVLNAGIMAVPSLQLTEHGFEQQLGVNHMGHAHLMSFFENFLSKQNIPSRTVVLSSTAHTFGNIDVNDLHYTKGRKYSAWGAYGQSKLANLLFAKSLGDRFQGTPATAMAVHPGVIKTNLWQNTPAKG